MPQAQDEDIRIYQLPEAQELASGMKVAVDSETDGTKSFDLSNLAGKVSVYEIHASGWPPVYTYPSATSVRNDVTAGKVVLLVFIIDNESCKYYSIDKLDSSTGDIIFYPSTSACDTATAFMLSQSGIWSNQEVDK